jgi:putative membrane protein
MSWISQGSCVGLMIGLSLSLLSPAVAKEDRLGKKDMAFLADAAEAQEAEMTVSQMAMERSGNEAVKQFAQRMFQDHTKASQEVSKLAESLGMSLTKPRPERPRRSPGKLSQLSGAAFDQGYIKHELSDHKKTLAEFAKKAQALKHPQIREWASATLPVLKEHIILAKSLAGTLSKGSLKKTLSQP